MSRAEFGAQLSSLGVRGKDIALADALLFAMAHDGGVTRETLRAMARDLARGAAR